MRPSPETLARAAREVGAIRHKRERLERQLMRSRYEPRKVFRVNTKALRRLGTEIAALPKRRRIRAEQARRLIRIIERLERRVRRVDTLVARALHQQKQILYRARLGSVTLDNLSMANGLDRFAARAVDLVVASVPESEVAAMPARSKFCHCYLQQQREID